MVISLKSTTLLLASSKEVGVKATAGIVDTVSVEDADSCFFEVHFEKRIVAMKASKMNVFFIVLIWDEFELII